MLKKRAVTLLILLASFGSFGIGYIVGNASAKQKLLNDHLYNAVIDISNVPPRVPPTVQEQQ